MIEVIVATLLAAAPATATGDAGAGQVPPGSASAAQSPAPPAQAPRVGAQPAPAAQGDAGGQGGADQKKLEEEIARELGASPPSAAQPGAGPAAAPPAAPAATAQGGGAGTGGNPFARLLLMPDISAIGSFALAWNQLDVGRVSPRSDPFAPVGQVRPIFQELEVGLQAVVDPYARADVFLTFDPNGAGVEEAYVTTLDLPAGLQVRAGELYAPFGRQNLQHAHTWDFVDRPLALGRQLAVDGLRGPGVDASLLLPLPWYAELHLAYQAVSPAFDPASRVAGLGRLLQFFDVGDATALGVGVSGAVVDEGQGATRDLYGADLFLKYRPPAGRAYLALQAEALARRLGQDSPSGPGGALETAGTSFGGYVQAVHRVDAFWEYGARYERAPTEPDTGPEQRISLLGAWIRTEFERVRLQLSYDHLPDGRDGVEALLHLEFIIGAHGAHPF